MVRGYLIYGVYMRRAPVGWLPSGSLYVWCGGMAKPTGWGGLCVKCDAAVCYSPTPCRVQYHRRARS